MNGLKLCWCSDGNEKWNIPKPSNWWPCRGPKPYWQQEIQPFFEGLVVRGVCLGLKGFSTRIRAQILKRFWESKPESIHLTYLVHVALARALSPGLLPSGVLLHTGFQWKPRSSGRFQDTNLKTCKALIGLSRLVSIVSCNMRMKGRVDPG